MKNIKQQKRNKIKSKELSYMPMKSRGTRQTLEILYVSGTLEVRSDISNFYFKNIGQHTVCRAILATGDNLPRVGGVS